MSLTYAEFAPAAQEVLIQDNTPKVSDEPVAPMKRQCHRCHGKIVLDDLAIVAIAAIVLIFILK